MKAKKVPSSAIWLKDAYVVAKLVEINEERNSTIWESWELELSTRQKGDKKAEKLLRNWKGSQI